MIARFLLILSLCLATSCATGGQSNIPDLSTEPWRATRAGTVGVALVTGVASGYEVDSTVNVVAANFGDPVSLHGDMVGRYGVGVQGEYYPIDDLMLFLGAERRAFEPDLGEEAISFGEASQNEIFIGMRYFLPYRFLKSQRLRAFVQAKLAYIPSVEFEMESRLEFDPPLNDAVLVSPYSGSDYWSIGAGAGFAYQYSDSVLLSFGFFYELPLGASEGRSAASLKEATGNSFVDNILDQLEYDVELEPRGWISFLRLSYAF
ncbi:MAG: hypothetical protein ACI8X5_000697 [Planctomycetota bacterium]|jgi:hypothetical protein